MGISNQLPSTGRVLKENGDTINYADILASIFNLSSGEIKVLLGNSNGFIGRSGAKAFKISGSITRPSNTTQYAINDAITDNSTTIMNFDLSSFGATNGQFFAIINARVISSVKASTPVNSNIWIMKQTFNATNDNDEFSIDDATAQTGGIVIPCLNTYSTAVNHRAVSDPGQWLGQLAANDTKLYFALQSANTYTPTSGERFDIVIEGLLL